MLIGDDFSHAVKRGLPQEDPGDSFLTTHFGNSDEVDDADIHCGDFNCLFSATTHPFTLFLTVFSQFDPSEMD